jgi:hypothetical protein
MTQRVFSIAASADDGDVVRVSAGEWPPVGAISAFTPGTEILCRKNRFGGGTGEIYVILLRFDTSTLSDADVVTAATLRISVTGIASSEARDLNIEYYDSGAAISDDDWILTCGTTGAQVAAATWQAWATSGTVDVTLGNLSSISTTGTTGLRIGLSGDAQPPLGNDTRLNIAAFDHATRDEPKLIVTTADAPTVNPDYSKFPKAILRRT